MKAADEVRRIKLKQALAQAEADVASGRVTILSADQEVDAFFARL